MGVVLQANESELLPISQCQRTPCSPKTLRPNLPKMVLKTAEMSNSLGPREWSMPWGGAGARLGVSRACRVPGSKWGHPGMVSLATAMLALRSSLTLGTCLAGL